MINNKKVQKYSIRKYSVGAASILIGTLLFLNPSNAEAQELEPNSSETKSKENEEISQGNDATITDEVQEQEKTPEVNNTQNIDEPTNKEEITSQERETQNTDEAAKQEVSPEENKVQSKDESKNTKEITIQNSNEQNADEAPEQEVNTKVNKIQNIDEPTDEDKVTLEENEAPRSNNEQSQKETLKANEVQNKDESKDNKEKSTPKKEAQHSGEIKEQESTSKVKEQQSVDNSKAEVTPEVKEAQKISATPEQEVKLNIKSTPLKRSKRQLPELPTRTTDIPAVPIQNRTSSNTFSPRSVNSLLGRTYHGRNFAAMRGINNISENSTRRDAIEVIENNKQHLTEKEREFYLRNIARKLNLPKNEKTWNNLFKNSIDTKLINRKVARNQVNEVNKVLESMKNLINNRQGDFYTELSNNNVKKITANDLRYIGTEKINGKYVVSFDLSKELGAGVKRFETLSLKVNDSLNSKIESVLVDYTPHKGLGGPTKTLNRDSLGYYSFTTEPKNKAGASTIFKLVLKSATEIDSTKDKVGIQLISDTNYPNPVHGVNLELKTVDMKPIAQKVNSDIKKIKDQEAKGQVQPPVDNQAKDEAIKAVEEAEKADKAAKDKLAQANADGVINPNEHQALVNAAKTAVDTKAAAEAKVNALSENQKGNLPKRLDALTGIVVPNVNDKDSNGVADNLDQAKTDAIKAVEEAERADKAAKEALTKANADGVINPNEHQELTEKAKQAKIKKEAAEAKVNALPDNQKGDLPKRLNGLTGIVVPGINDKDSNGVEDNLDQAKVDAIKAVEEAEKADKEAKESLVKANEDGVINPKEHQELEAASKQAKDTKASAEAKVNNLPDNQKGELPKRLDALTGIVVPNVNDKDSNGVADNLDQAKADAIKAVEEAEKADKVAKDALVKANEDGVINPKEHQELVNAAKTAVEKKAAAEAKVNALPDNQKGNLPKRLDALTGIAVPGINDKDSNGVADNIDQAKTDAITAVEEAEKADKAAKDKLAKANEDGVINPKEYQELEAASKQAKDTKASAEAKVNNLPDNQKGELPKRLDALKGIVVPNVNDKDSNGIADNIDQAKADAIKAVEEAEKADKTAKEALTKANKDGLINPKEHQELTEKAQQAKIKKEAAEAKVNALPDNQKGDLPKRLDALTGIDIPIINDKDSNGVADNLDEAKEDAIKAVEEAEKADKVAKDKLAQANEDGVINSNEHQELEAASKQAKETKAEAEAKVNALSENQKRNLPERLEALTGIDVPNINDQDNNSIEDNIDQAKEDAIKAVEEAEKADKAAKDALTKAKEDGAINPKEHQELIEKAQQAESKKKSAEAKVNTLPKNKQGNLQERLDKLMGIKVPNVNDQNSNGLADELDGTLTEVANAVEAAKQADAQAKEALVKANEDGKISQAEVNKLMDLAKKAKETKATAEALVKELPETPNQLKAKKAEFNKVLAQLTGIAVPTVTDNKVPGQQDNLHQAKEDAIKAVEEAEKADKAAKDALTKAKEDGAINPKEHQELTEKAQQAKETKAAAEAKVNNLPDNQKGDLPQRLGKLTGIVVPNVNDKDSNGIADNIDQAAKDATQAVEEAEKTDKEAKDKLAQANEDGVINPKEYQELTEKAQQAETKKKAAEDKVNVLPDNQKGDLPKRIDALTGIDIPSINDKDSNGIADNLDQAKADAIKAVEEAEKADKVAKDNLVKANEDGVINPKELQDLTDLAKQAKETKAAAEAKVNVLPDNQKGDLPKRLEALTGIDVPNVNSDVVPKTPSKDGNEMTPEVSGKGGKETTPKTPSKDGNEMMPEVSGEESKEVTPTVPSENGTAMTPEISSKDDKVTAPKVSSEVSQAMAPKTISKDKKTMSSKKLDNSNNDINELPKTGNDSTNSHIYTGVLALFGSLLLFVRRRKNKSN